MKKRIILAAIAALSVPLAAQAEGAYAGVSAGRAEQKLHIDSISLDDSATGYKLYAGYNFLPNVGVEVGYANLGEASVSGNGARASAEPKPAYLAATGTLPVSAEVSVFGKLGVAVTRTKLSATLSGVKLSQSENETTPYVGIGASYAFSKNVSVVAEYEYFGKVLKDGSAYLKADLLSAGVRYSF
jgi:OOP family OmpA-OmpF porin